MLTPASVKPVDLMEYPAREDPEKQYPERDGKPLAETDFHLTLIVYLVAILRAYFRAREDVYVASDMLVYYRESEPGNRVAPDLFVVFDVPRHKRRTWQVWREGKGPDAVFEFTSDGAWGEDMFFKKGLYAHLGVAEYFLFDPLGDYLEPRFQGFRLVDGEYEPIPLDDGKQLTSERLGLVMRAEGDDLLVFEIETGQRLLPPPELAEALERERASRTAAESRLQQAEEELARLRAELQDLRSRGEGGHQ